MNGKMLKNAPVESQKEVEMRLWGALLRRSAFRLTRLDHTGEA